MTSPIHQQSYYELLEVTTSASLDEIQKAYSRTKKLYSLDRPALYSMFSKEEAQELLHLIETAYQTLSHKMRRLNYDLELKNNSLNISNHSIHSMKAISFTAMQKEGVLPKGFARSKVSVYEVVPQTEEWISNEIVFDGSFLQKVRMYKNIDLEKMSQVTCISRSYLAAIESNDFEALPAAVFVRGFIIQICKTLHLNSEKMANTYMHYFNKGCVGQS